MSNWFAHCHTLDEVRAEYRRLCFVHHPDHGGDTLVMQAINVAYDQARRMLSAPRGAPAQNGSRRHWQRPTPRTASGHPNDHPPEQERRRATEQERQPLHSRDYFQSIWNHTPWQPLDQGGYTRQLWQHQVIVFQHADPKFERAWFVMLDNVFSPYFYATRSEAERAAFDLLYEKVKFLDV
jgi:hypothetical protein